MKESIHKKLENDFQSIPDDNNDPVTPPCYSENSTLNLLSWNHKL